LVERAQGNTNSVDKFRALLLNSRNLGPTIASAQSMILAQSAESSNEILMSYKRQQMNGPTSPSSSLNRRRVDFPDVMMYQQALQLQKDTTTADSGERSPHQSQFIKSNDKG